jgi:hypothetical protein
MTALAGILVRTALVLFAPFSPPFDLNEETGFPFASVCIFQIFGTTSFVKDIRCKPARPRLSPGLRAKGRVFRQSSWFFSFLRLRVSSYKLKFRLSCGDQYGRSLIGRGLGAS